MSEAMTQARLRGMLRGEDGLWESLEVTAPAIGAADRRGPGNVAMVPVEHRGQRVVAADDAERYAYPVLGFVVGSRRERVAWRDATAEETAPLEAVEQAQDAAWERLEERRRAWVEIRARFLQHGEPFPEERSPGGEVVREVADAAGGNYYIVLDEGRFLWWAQLEPVSLAEWEQGVRPPMVAYRLPWDEELATRIRETEPMPDVVSVSG